MVYLNKKHLFLMIILLLFLTASISAGNKTKVTVDVKAWLSVGPIPVYSPPMNDGKEWDIEKILKYENFDFKEFFPEQGLKLQWLDGKVFEWKKIDSDQIVMKRFKDSNHISYHAAYLDAKDFLKSTLKIKTRCPLIVYLDGKNIQERIAEAKKDDALDVNLVLEPGFHVLLIKTAALASKKEDGVKLSAVIEYDKSIYEAELNTSLLPAHRTGIYEILNIPQISTARISADGKYVAVNLHKVNPEDGSSESWIELRNTEDGNLIKSYRGFGNISSLRWAPKSNKFAFVTRGDKGQADLWLVDIDKGTSDPIIRGMKRFSYYSWFPNEKYIIYTVKDEGKKDLEGIKRHKSLSDRQEGNRDKSHLYIISIDSKASIRLSSGDIDIYCPDVHPSGKSLLINKNIEDYSQRPYFYNELYLLDLNTMKMELLLKDAFLNNFIWAFNGEKIAVLGGPSAFNKLGYVLKDERIPNDYDVQAYLFDPKTKEAEAISKEFDPSINSIDWNRFDNHLYFGVTEGAKREIYKYCHDEKKFIKIETLTDVINGVDFAASAPVAIYYGSQVSYPTSLYSLNLTDGSSKLIYNPSSSDMEKVVKEKVENWNFTNSSGDNIEGIIYYPPDFCPDKKWPLIVYYYGGTSPVTMDYGGRYPKNWWAANGYVVYVLQPRGTVGYGQDFSAYHVNDWGVYALNDIIEGTKEFLKAHNFIDPKRVGCIGASYGGFTTELLITRTDIYAAAVSHAGISLLPSYWGGGYWGYSYSAVASANSFPWNNKELYVERSPLFNADKINTPLLLLHGSVDTNVPTHESDYLYTALKLLGKEVEYIKVIGENHWVIDYKKRVNWYKTILAWYDEWLKGKPQYWEYLYPPERGTIDTKD